MTYLYDTGRHLICVPYSIENLHLMAKDLGLKKCWFHAKKKKKQAHYDIPKSEKQRAHIESQSRLISKQLLLSIIKNSHK